MSNMVVATNVMALNSHRNLKTVGTTQSRSSARLSSGYRINSAADDAAGLAISEKMRSQIRGLDMASKNSQDAISLIQTAEGGMQEIDNMLQRIRELVVQASNDTNEQSTDADAKNRGDRQKIQDEINNLVGEIDSMAGRVEFNNKKVINGDFRDPNVENLKKITQPAAANIKKTTEATTADPTKEQQAIADLFKKVITSNDFVTLSSETGEAEAQAFVAEVGRISKLDPANLTYSEFAELLEADGSTTKADDLKSSYGGAVSNIQDMLDTIKGIADTLDESATLPDPLADGITGTAGNLDASIAAVYASGSKVDDMVQDGNYTGSLAKLEKVFQATTVDAMKTAWSDFVSEAKTDDTNNSNATTAKDMFSDSTTRDAIAQALADKLASLKASEAVGDTVAAVQGDAVTLYFQVGANANQKLELNINSAKSDALGIGDGNGKTYIDVVRATGSEITKLLDGLDNALSFVTTERSKLGAAQNRLEYTIKSLDISSENLSAAESRIRDTDMAKEMMKLTQANVLQQAATAMLAQANQAPQNVLQLLK